MNFREQDDKSHPSITNEGFQFLLLDTASQVWYFTIKYLETVETRGLSLPECLAFMFSLSFGTLGKDYSSEGLDEPMLNYLQHLREFGLIHQRSVCIRDFVLPTAIIRSSVLKITQTNSIDVFCSGKQVDFILQD